LKKIDRGNSQATSKKDIDRILEFLEADKNDIFCDLGSGKGKAVMYASEKVNFAYGIENYYDYFHFSQNLKKKRKKPNVKFIKGNYTNKKTLRKVSDSTIIYCINEEPLSTYKLMESIFQPKSLFVTLGYPPYPIKVQTFIDEYFYVMEIPFHMAKTPKEWVFSVLGKKGSMTDVYKKIRRDWKPKYAKEMIDDLKELSDSTQWLVNKYKKH